MVYPQQQHVVGMQLYAFLPFSTTIYSGGAFTYIPVNYKILSTNFAKMEIICLSYVVQGITDITRVCPMHVHACTHADHVTSLLVVVNDLMSTFITTPKGVLETDNQR